MAKELHLTDRVDFARHILNDARTRYSLYGVSDLRRKVVVTGKTDVTDSKGTGIDYSFEASFRKDIGLPCSYVSNGHYDSDDLNKPTPEVFTQDSFKLIVPCLRSKVKGADLNHLIEGGKMEVWYEDKAGKKKSNLGASSKPESKQKAFENFKAFAAQMGTLVRA